MSDASPDHHQDGGEIKEATPDQQPGCGEIKEATPDHQPDGGEIKEATPDHQPDGGEIKVATPDHQPDGGETGGAASTTQPDEKGDITKINEEAIIQAKIENRRKYLAAIQDGVNERWGKLDDEVKAKAGRYRPLMRALHEKNGKVVSEFVNQNLDDLLVDPIDEYGRTIFDFIFNVPGADEAIEKLVFKVSEEFLKRAWTALGSAALIGNTKAVKLILNRYKNLLVFKHTGGGWLPIDFALNSGRRSNRETVEFLLSAHAAREKRFDDEFPDECALVLFKLIRADHIDLAFDFLIRYSKLADPSANKHWRKTMNALAEKDLEIPDGTIQRLIYRHIPVKVAKHDSTRGDVENQTPMSEKPNTFRRFKYKLWSMLIPLVPAMKNTCRRKLMHEQICEMITRMTAEKMWYPEEVSNLLMEPMFTAAKYGNYLLVDKILKACNFSFMFWDEYGHTAFHFAIFHRQANVFNLIHDQLSLTKEFMNTDKDVTNSNLLHLAAKLAPSEKVPGAALKMQRELQWYKTVEDIFSPDLGGQRNVYGKTPREVFTKEHENLVKEGEKWMKETATACSVVAALILTIIFSTTYTFPGGIDDKGTPKFLPKASFKVFLISIALALFSSIASVVMFLGILTARYAEEDFLKSLPKKLILGLVTLFFSIGSMMVAFASTFYIYLQESVWVTPIMIILVFLVVTLFASMEFPLFVDVLKSTYGDGIFKKVKGREE